MATVSQQLLNEVMAEQRTQFAVHQASGEVSKSHLINRSMKVLSDSSLKQELSIKKPKSLIKTKLKQHFVP